MDISSLCHLFLNWDDGWFFTLISQINFHQQSMEKWKSYKNVRIAQTFVKFTLYCWGMDALLRIALALARARVPAAEFAWLVSDAASSETATTPNMTVRCMIPSVISTDFWKSSEDARKDECSYCWCPPSFIVNLVLAVNERHEKLAYNSGDYLNIEVINTVLCFFLSVSSCTVFPSSLMPNLFMDFIIQMLSVMVNECMFPLLFMNFSTETICTRFVCLYEQFVTRTNHPYKYQLATERLHDSTVQKRPLTSYCLSYQV